jgi:hypothetical protein
LPSLSNIVLLLKAVYISSLPADHSIDHWQLYICARVTMPGTQRNSSSRVARNKRPAKQNEVKDE